MFKVENRKENYHFWYSVRFYFPWPLSSKSSNIYEIYQLWLVSFNSTHSLLLMLQYAGSYYEFTYLHDIMYVAHARKVDLCCINVILIMLCSVHNITCSEKSAILRLHWPFVYFAWSHSSCKAFSSLSSVSDIVDIIMAGIKSLEKRWITL